MVESRRETTGAESHESAADTAQGLGGAVHAAQQFLLANQAEDGHWCAELEGDTILESEYVLTLQCIGRGCPERLRKAAEYLRRKQRPEGGWAIYPGGPAEISASVKAYFVLKLFGDDPQADHMRRAAAAVQELGGVESCNSFTKIYLAIFGQYDWAACPAIPPEMILLPRWFPFNIYAMSSWTRAIVVPLSIMWALKPRCEVPASAGIGELFTGRGAAPPVNAPRTARGRLWYRFFGLLDRFLKLVERVPLKPLRRRALRRAESWIHERLRDSDGLGAIFPPIINTLIAFDGLESAEAKSALEQQLAELERLVIEEDETLRVQPCFSPVWDTALVMNSLLNSGLDPATPELRAAGRWLLDKEVRGPGDWQVNNRGVEPGGWFFEYANEPYPDCDDTAEVLTVLAPLRFPDAQQEHRRESALERGLAWLLSMQNDDGGWAAFDKGCDREFLTFVPFADHNAMIDPSCEDITGRTLEALVELGWDGDHAVIKRAVEFLLATQQTDGTWYGRWGCNYIYGTWLVLSGLRRVGVDLREERFTRAGRWLLERQNEDGGWGETPGSYDHPELAGRGDSTAAQTAWALLALFALELHDSETVRRGVAYLRGSQGQDGSWLDEPWTGTGFPRVFYLRYHYYATYFPLLALAAYHGWSSRSAGSAAAASGDEDKAVEGMTV